MFHIHTAMITPKHEHRLLSLMIISFHLSLWWDFGSLISTFWLFLHFSLFLLWQPLWGRHDVPTLKTMLFLSSGIALFLLMINGWLITAWQLILIGLIGGRDLVKPWDKILNLVAVVILSLDMFIFNVHYLFIFEPDTIHYWLHLPPQQAIHYFLTLIPLSFWFVTTDDNLEYRYHIDFFHGLILALLMMLIALGSLTLVAHNQLSYPLAVFQMSLVLSLFILIISWLWVIFTGENNIELLWTRHLLHVGHSLELWLENLAQPNNYKEMTPQQYLVFGFEQLAALPWVAGLTWQGLNEEGMLGHRTKNNITIETHSLRLSVYSYYRISGSHHFLIKLLLQLLDYFYQAKQREEAFAQQAHLQAVYEMGAKVTHDIKNLLQSLHAISSAIESCQPAQFGDTQRLLQGQMPHLTQRLKRALDKLQKPAELSFVNVPVGLWWNNIKIRYRPNQVEFVEKIESEKILVPENLLNNALENLLQNALTKQKRESNLSIEVSLYVSENRFKLIVCDDGSVIPEEVAKNLLHQPVPSKDGFGIGLYQAATQLSNAGYVMRLLENQPGIVCFEIINNEYKEE